MSRRETSGPQDPQILHHMILTYGVTSNKKIKSATTKFISLKKENRKENCNITSEIIHNVEQEYGRGYSYSQEAGDEFIP